MATKVNNQAASLFPNKKTSAVNVAVAVIYYKDEYLLGFRSAEQHQGNRYEFVGGKIETHENAEQALIREVAEETGIAIHGNTIVKLGRLHHDYADKQVSLQVYKIELTVQQYEQYQHCDYGLEGQALTWVNKSSLLAGEYQLPAANKTILEWLKVPENIAITYPLVQFSECVDPVAAWLQYHQEHLMPKSWVYIRIKADGLENIAAQLMDKRPDIQAIVPYYNSHTLHTEQSPSSKSNTSQNVAYHLTHTALMQWSDNTRALPDRSLLSNLPLVVSCHDSASIHAANELADHRIQQQLPPVIAIFISPVLTTQTHPDTMPLGWESWSELAQLADMPVIGLGGLSPEMIDQALVHGGISVAGIRQFFNKP
ncbi:MAG: NUDIX domain-containing protein [Psychrobacter sp.]|uniref:NUDIX domain-containing protein n=1 Tax=unclassified Psychrobacter TaxID=196806 RepID=UPI003F9CF267